MEKEEQKGLSKGIKEKIVLDVLSGRMSKEEARRIYGIKSKSSILEWMRKSAGIHPKSHGEDPVPILRNMKEIPDKQAELHAEIARLKAELEYSQLKGRAYQIMVQIAREEHNLDLEKKHGAKQSINSKKRISSQV